MTAASSAPTICGGSIAGPANSITTLRSAWRPSKCGSRATTFFSRCRSVPELPEVETVARSIAPLVGRRIVAAEFRNLRILRGGDPDEMSRRIQGRQITAIKRYGKYILLTLDQS